MRGLSDRDTTTGQVATSARPRIAVISQWAKDTDHGKLPLPYTHAVTLGGGEPVVVSTFVIPDGDERPQHLEVIQGVDENDASCLEGMAALVVPGGGDIDPALYGQEPHPRTQAVNHQRDAFEFALMEEALRRDMPVLAICHGMQALNVYLGGTLEQHLADNPDRLDHDRDRPRAEAAHKVTVTRDGTLASVLGCQALGVNSHHHQGLEKVAEPLREVAWAGDGVLEAVESTRHSWVVGVQWHPEAMAPVDETQADIFRALVEAARAFMAGSQPTRRSA